MRLSRTHIDAVIAMGKAAALIAGSGTGIGQAYTAFQLAKKLDTLLFPKQDQTIIESAGSFMHIMGTLGDDSIMLDIAGWLGKAAMVDTAFKKVKDLFSRRSQQDGEVLESEVEKGEQEISSGVSDSDSTRVALDLASTYRTVSDELVEDVEQDVRSVPQQLGS